MTTDRVMLLIDADNVSVDVIEQVVERLLDVHGALHVRRAYGTAESAVKNQAAFKRMGIKPMVNLATGKNSTDIALAVDALDLVLAERPDVVAIASSDSDFAPLVQRLREKGCRVVGFGQDGKTGEETLQVYDDYTVLAHRKGQAATAEKAVTARRRAPAKRSSTAISEARTAAAPAPAAKKAAAKRKPAARKTAAVVEAPAAAPAPPPPPPPPPPVPEKVQQILNSLPELVRGDTVELRVASVRLREAGLLSRSGSCTKLFAPFADRFELLPAGQPNHVRLRSITD